MDRSLVGLAQLIGVFAVAKSALWLLTFLGTDIPLAEIVRDLPGLLLSELAGATIAILIAVQLISPSKALVFGITVGAFQVLTAGLIELGRMTAAGFDTLKEELRWRQQEERPRIIEANTDARSHGDLSENAE